MKLNDLTPEQRAMVRMRFIARAQLSYLHLHDDLCLKVLNEYGCNVIIIERTTETKQGCIEANWPHPASTRQRYLGTLLDHLTQRVLNDTAQADAIFAADALT